MTRRYRIKIVDIKASGTKKYYPQYKYMGFWFTLMNNSYAGEDIAEYDSYLAAMNRIERDILCHKKDVIEYEYVP